MLGTKVHNTSVIIFWKIRKKCRWHSMKNKLFLFVKWTAFFCFYKWNKISMTFGHLIEWDSNGPNCSIWTFVLLFDNSFDEQGGNWIFVLEFHVFEFYFGRILIYGFHFGDNLVEINLFKKSNNIQNLFWKIFDFSNKFDKLIKTWFDISIGKFGKMNNMKKSKNGINFWFFLING